MWTWAEWLSRSPHIWELLLCHIKLKSPSRVSRSTPIFCNFFHLANPAPLLPWITDSWTHLLCKLSGMKDLGLESRGITKTHVTGVMSILPALLFAAGWRSVIPVCVISSFWKLRQDFRSISFWKHAINQYKHLTACSFLKHDFFSPSLD